MSTEKQCQLMIERLSEKIKKLREEFYDRIAKKKKWQKNLRDLKWEAKVQKKYGKKAAKPYPIETMAAKINRKATKKKVVKKLYRPNR